MRFLQVLFLGLWASAAVADTPAPALPALFSVTGVAANDQLNVRDSPHADAAIIAALAPDATSVEVTALSRQGNWARLNAGERIGWVAMRYLQRQTVATNALELPVGLQCFGTEPFWTMTFPDGANLVVTTPEGETGHAITRASPAPLFVDLATTGMRFEWRAQGGGTTAHILPGACSDGMSDNAYGLHYLDDHGPRKGCCSLK